MALRMRASSCTVLLLAELLAGFQSTTQDDLFVLWENENVKIAEDVSVGSTVVRLRDFLAAKISSAEDGNEPFWSVNITTGDGSGRFGVRAEDLAVIVAAPLDYQVHPRYNLTVELRNIGSKAVFEVTLVIVVMDVPGYPPFYNKRCETPVLPHRDLGGSHTVLSSDDGFYMSVNGDEFGSFADYLQYPLPRHYAANFVFKDDCSLRYVVRVTNLYSDEALIPPALQGTREGRVELKCHDPEWKNIGKLTALDISLDDDLPQWVQSGQFQMTESARYVFAVEFNEIWSTSSYWIRCGANVTFLGGINLFEWTFEYNITGCPEGWYGMYCDKGCVCQNGARCHGYNGACKCRPGWRGRVCDIPWPEVVIVETPGDSAIKYIATILTLTCLAPHIQVANITWAYRAGKGYNDTKVIEEGAVQNSAISFQPILESANGRYSCMVQAEDGQLFRATFILNATECRPNYYGEACSRVCDCQYGGTCDRWEGCLCPPGRHGNRCDQIHKNEVVVVVLASVIPTIGIAIIGCIVAGILVRVARRRQRTSEHSTADLEMTSLIETLSSWEVDKENIRFENMIGEGEFGHVVRGRLRVPEGYEVLVAAKSIRPDRMTASAVRDFRREMTILTRIHEDKEGHPNVVRLYGVVTMSEPHYILVEYASNEELRRYLWSLREQRKTTGNSKLLERLGFACDVASGLSELARLKIVHRDIAARNVVISDKKVAKIADFGLSRDVYVSSAYKRSNQGGEEDLLPLKWMAVESLRDGVYTCESDVWSYGVLLWEIASFGEEPRYAGGPKHPDVCTMLELLKKGVRLQQPENCPMSVYKIIRSCWIVDPLKRPTPDELFRKIDLMRPQRRAAQLANHNI
ncbi:RET [Branchiostoma lanceolatum]|uniref:RET protein n=1 Tax=Branchiostoma lanceolatum TaxID=7740 RepID=A0A8J9Z0P4_BRALA|nr:RET [Branchiostoma lanceolatum]